MSPGLSRAPGPGTGANNAAPLPRPPCLPRLRLASPRRVRGLRTAGAHAMAMSEEVVSRELEKVLAEADLSQVTERQIRGLVAERLQCDISPFKGTIQVTWASWKTKTDRWTSRQVPASRSEE